MSDPINSRSSSTAFPQNTPSDPQLESHQQMPPILQILQAQRPLSTSSVTLKLKKKEPVEDQEKTNHPSSFREVIVEVEDSDSDKNRRYQNAANMNSSSPCNPEQPPIPLLNSKRTREKADPEKMEVKIDPDSVESTQRQKVAKLDNHSSPSASFESVNFFENFPEEIVYTIINWLDAKSLSKLLQADHYFYALITTDPNFQKESFIGQAVEKMLQRVTELKNEQDKNQAMCLIALLQLLTDPRKAFTIANNIHIPI